MHQPPLEAVDEYAAKKEALAAGVNRIMIARPDLAALIGPNNREMMEQNHRNHVLFMESLFRDFHPRTLVETVLWVFRAYRSHGFQLAYWPALLDNFLFLLRRELSDSAYQAIRPFYDWLLINQPHFAAISDAMIEKAAGAGPDHTDTA